MEKKAFGSSSAPLSPGLKVGRTIFVSGQVPRTPEGTVVAGGVAAQTERVLDNIEAVLNEAGATMADVVKTTVILPQVKRDFAAMNEIYARRFPDPKPSRTTLGADLAIDILVEIEAIAIVDD
ncbi:MAG: RidA family protein [Trueperaceae bacterium]